MDKGFLHPASAAYAGDDVQAAPEFKLPRTASGSIRDQASHLLFSPPACHPLQACRLFWQSSAFFAERQEEFAQFQEMWNAIAQLKNHTVVMVMESLAKIGGDDSASYYNAAKFFLKEAKLPHIERLIDLPMPDYLNRSVLAHAAISANVESVVQILNLGASPNILVFNNNGKGVPLLFYMASLLAKDSEEASRCRRDFSLEKYRQIFEILVRHGALLVADIGSPCTVLHYVRPRWEEGFSEIVSSIAKLHGEGVLEDTYFIEWWRLFVQESVALRQSHEAYVPLVACFHRSICNITSQADEQVKKVAEITGYHPGVARIICEYNYSPRYPTSEEIKASRMPQDDFWLLHAFARDMRKIAVDYRKKEILPDLTMLVETVDIDDLVIGIHAGIELMKKSVSFGSMTRDWKALRRQHAATIERLHVLYNEIKPTNPSSEHRACVVM